MGTRDELREALNPVAQEFERLGVVYLIGGSVASAAHGEFRATNDVDLVADLRPEHVGPLVAALGDAYYASETAIREAVLRRSSFNLIHLDTMLKIDVFASRGRAYDAVALSRRVHQRFDPDDAASALYIATAEDIVVAKLEWFRNGGEQSEQQWRDILGVLRVQGPSIDVEYLREWAGRLNVIDLLERALRERDAE